MAGLNQFTNNAATTLASGINSSVTSLSVASGTGALFPTLAGSQYFYCTLANNAGTVEIVKVTARSTDTFTIVRGQDNTTAAAWVTGDKVELRVTAGDLNNFPQLDSTNTFASAQTFSAAPILSTLTGVVLGAGSSAATAVAAGTTGNVLTSNGTTWTSAAAAAFDAGTRLAFQQTAAPTGWTKDTTAAINDSMLRLVTGAASSGGTTAFSTWSAATATGAYTLATTDIPSHTHTFTASVTNRSTSTTKGGQNTGSLASGSTTDATGGGGSHTHSLTNSLKYYDFIIASKN
jgi:hypothetical protein